MKYTIKYKLAIVTPKPMKCASTLYGYRVNVKNVQMNKFKQVNKTRIKLNGKSYKGYMLGDLPPTFAYKSCEDIDEHGEEKEGFTHWFNYKGLTYIG